MNKSKSAMARQKGGAVGQDGAPTDQSKSTVAQQLARAASAFEQRLTGQLFAIFIMTVAAAEAAVGLAIVITVYRLRHTIQVDEIDLLKG